MPSETVMVRMIMSNIQIYSLWQVALCAGVGRFCPNLYLVFLNI